MSSSHQPSAGDELQQYEREAIIDLLHLCTYADAMISLKEGGVVSQALMRMGWDHSTSFREFEAKSLDRVRLARRDPESTQAFIAQTVRRLHSPRARQLAVDYCTRLFAADGSTPENEQNLLGQIRTALTGPEPR